MPRTGAKDLCNGSGRYFVHVVIRHRNGFFGLCEVPATLLITATKNCKIQIAIWVEHKQNPIYVKLYSYAPICAK